MGDDVLTSGRSVGEKWSKILYNVGRLEVGGAWRPSYV